VGYTFPLTTVLPQRQPLIHSTVCDGIDWSSTPPDCEGSELVVTQSYTVVSNLMETLWMHLLLTLNTIITANIKSSDRVYFKMNTSSHKQTSINRMINVQNCCSAPLQSIQKVSCESSCSTFLLGQRPIMEVCINNTMSGVSIFSMFCNKKCHTQRYLKLHFIKQLQASIAALHNSHIFTPITWTST
jgi:hypothetical protein